MAEAANNEEATCMMVRVVGSVKVGCCEVVYVQEKEQKMVCMKDQKEDLNPDLLDASIQPHDLSMSMPMLLCPADQIR